MPMREEAKMIALQAKGFLAEAEGLCLYELAEQSSPIAPCFEIGSYCGKSTIFIAEGCRVADKNPLFALDHHRGSVEQQLGQPFFDPALYNKEDGMIYTLDHFMRNIRKAGLVDWVIPIITDSARLGRYWRNVSFGLVFIDGGHSEEDAFQDYSNWGAQVAPGGYLCIHDIFRDPAYGGQAPFHVLEHALTTGLFDFVDQVETLGILRRR
jgi:predicted O-methyltransferase YrrM